MQMALASGTAAKNTMVDAAHLITLQNVIFPEQGICTEAELYFHIGGLGGYKLSTGDIFLENGATAFFDTYFNAFSLGKWHESCHLDGLFLGVMGEGQVEIKVWHAIPDRSWEMLVSEVLALARNTETLFDLSHYARNAVTGVIYFEVRALSGRALASLSQARYLTRKSKQPLPELAICITTFRREAEVQETVARLQAFLDDFSDGDHIRVFVVDNGMTAVIPSSTHVTHVMNRNLGGAGGFSRGLLEAEGAGATHCLFMDDDASFHMENIARTYMFLALARNSRNALAGAMINNTHKWAMWENGAVFDRACQPQFCGLDLRERGNVLHLEAISAREHRPNFYGGWWYFAFPIAHVKRRPFPFFVRGDDVSFSLANDFRIVTLNGVVSFQDDFTEKESPQTLYLDLRSHLVHHLVFDAIDRGPVGTAKVALRFIARSMVRCHYETVEAQLLAWEDVMRGPGFFAQNADMSVRRQAIRDLTKNETWQPVADLDLSERRRYTNRPGFWHKVFVRSLNGHLLPFFGRRGDQVVLPVGERGVLNPVWGASRITYLNLTRTKGYTVQHSKRRFLKLALRIAGATRRFVTGYAALQKSYRDAYPEMTARPFWEKLLEPGSGASTAEAAPPAHLVPTTPKAAAQA